MLVLFEDDHVARLDPVCLGKPAFAIGCGGYRLAELLVGEGSIEVRVRPHLHATVLPGFPLQPASEGLVLWVNARAVPSTATLEVLREVRRSGRAGIVRAGDGVAAASLPGAQSRSLPAEGPATAAHFNTLGLEDLPQRIKLFDYPHDIVRQHLAVMAGNLERRISTGNYVHAADGVFLAPDAMLGDPVTADTRGGAIVIEPGASVCPHTHLVGPVYVAHDARVLAHAAIKDCVSIGAASKVGGEVEGSIVESYTNKQHHGFLGHSYLGHWINIGAGTSNSDLKNTYGIVQAEYRGEKVSTGMQFFGTVVGDYVKTAINTSIFTGRMIGACSMLYGYVTTNVPSFVNYARSFGQMTELPLEVMAATQRRMFERRGVVQRGEDIELLDAMHRLTAHERQAVAGTLGRGNLLL